MNGEFRLLTGDTVSTLNHLLTGYYVKVISSELSIHPESGKVESAVLVYLKPIKTTKE